MKACRKLRGMEKQRKYLFGVMEDLRAKVRKWQGEAEFWKEKHDQKKHDQKEAERFATPAKQVEVFATPIEPSHHRRLLEERERRDPGGGRRRDRRRGVQE